MTTKCVCGGKLRKIKTRLELFGGDITINGVEAYFCPACGEELFTTDQAADAQERVFKTIPGFEAYRMQKKVAMLGNSLAIPLARELAHYMGLDKGDTVRITIKNRGRLIVD